MTSVKWLSQLPAVGAILVEAVPVWGSTAELEAGGVMVEVAKKGQSLSMWGYF